MERESKELRMKELIKLKQFRSGTSYLLIVSN